MHKVILLLDKFFFKYEGWGQIDPPRKKLPSKSPVLFGLNNICKYLESWQSFDFSNEKKDNVNAKTNNSNEETIMLIVISRIFKVLAIILLTAMLVTKMMLKILIVTIGNSILTTALQIRHILMK